MKILEFINSETVRSYLDSISYTPSTLAATYLVWQSKSHVLSEKEKALEWITKSMPDEKIPKHEFHGGWDSIHELIKKYITYVQAGIEAFKLSTGGGIYDFSVYYDEITQWINVYNLYSSYEKVIEAAEKFLIDDNSYTPRLIKIRRRTLDSNCGADYLYLTPSFDEYKIECASENMTDEEFKVIMTFQCLCPYVPHPFKIGDVICECAGKYALDTYYNNTVTVTGFHDEDYILSHQDTLDMNDFTIYGMCIDEDGNRYEDSIDHYLNAERI